MNSANYSSIGIILSVLSDAHAYKHFKNYCLSGSGKAAAKL